MAAPMEKTRHPGIYRRHVKDCSRNGRCDCSYVVVSEHKGKQRNSTHATLDEAREAKRLKARRAKLAKGHAEGLHADEPQRDCEECQRQRQEREAAQPTLREYALEWVERYQGTGRRGFREETRDEYRRLLDKFVLRYFPPRLLLGELSPRQVADYIGWLAKQQSRRDGGMLSDSSVHNALKPLSACLATARREGLIRHNPAADATLPHRPRVDDDENAQPFPLTADGEPTMELVVALVNPRYRLIFELLAATGVRRSELLALEGRHLALSGEQPHVKVRQRVRRQKGKGLVVGPLKSRYARRDLPIPLALADRLAGSENGGEGGCVPEPSGHVARPGQPARAGAVPGACRGRRRVGRLSHVPAHRRVAALC